MKWTAKKVKDIKENKKKLSSNKKRCRQQRKEACHNKEHYKYKESFQQKNYIVQQRMLAITKQAIDNTES